MPETSNTDAAPAPGEWWSGGAALLLVVGHIVAFVLIHFFASYVIAEALDVFGARTYRFGPVRLWRQYQDLSLAVLAAVAGTFFLLDAIILQQCFSRGRWITGLLWAGAVFAVQLVLALPWFIYLAYM